MTKVLFVCLGNICRSPAAEAIFQKLVHSNNLSEEFQIDSAGTSAHHEGELADPRMRQFGAERGFDLTSRSRPFEYDDFVIFDYIVTMDESNYRNVLSLDQKDQFQNKIFPMTDFVKAFDVGGVPDPYYGGDEGFRHVFDILEDGCQNLLDHIKKN